MSNPTSKESTIKQEKKVAETATSADGECAVAPQKSKADLRRERKEVQVIYKI
jgi:hypothetical protein